MATRSRPTKPRRRTLAASAVLAFAATAAARPRVEQSAEDGGAWTVLAPFKAVSAGGSTFTPQADGSILVAGANPEKDVWTLDFETDLAPITAIRLEALADESLPAKGPGRASNGNFVLNELRVEASAKLAFRLKPVELQRASCDFIQSGYRPEQVHDGQDLGGENGWAVHGETGKSHELVVETHRDVAFDGPTVLRLELHFNWGAQHAIGRFRVSATGRARPVLAAGAKPPEAWSKVQEGIHSALDSGVDYLLSQQQLDGSWNHEQWTYRNGATALAVYALVKSGLGARHPAVVRALEFMRGVPTRETYSPGCHLMALAAIDDPAHREWMEDLAQTLLAIQKGGFNYPWGGVDLSNTQYGVLGLRAAALHGVDVPAEAFEKAAQQALRFSDETEGGAYAPLGFTYNRGQKPTSSMTAAGIAVLAVAAEQLGGKGKAGAWLTAAKRGAQWYAQNWSTDTNLHDSHNRWWLYYLYGLERVGSLLDVDEIGGHPWYEDGARRLLEKQGGKGEWGSPYADHVINTSFALLFLNRATSVASGKTSGRVKIYGADDPKSPVSLRASGDTPLTVWISSFGAAELAQHEWPDERDRGPRVVKVEYVATGGAYGDREVVIAAVEKDGLQAAGDERFGVQWTFPLPGEYRVFARVTVATPSPVGAAPAATLLAPTLLVRIDETLDPELLECARDPARNLLAGPDVTATSSSKLNDDWAAARAVDNLQCRGWAAENLDPTPTLTLELHKPVRAGLVLLTPARIGEKYLSRITKVAVVVNRKQPGIVVDVPPGLGDRKIRVALPAAQVVRQLDVQVLAKEECAGAEKAVGFQEVELQLAKPGSKRP
jgi:hypothetical protein